MLMHIYNLVVGRFFNQEKLNRDFALAILERDTESAVDMVDLGADVNFKGALGEAARTNLPELAKALLEKGADPNLPLQHWGGIFPLHFAALRHSPEIAEMLLAHGARINAREVMGRTPLHFAATRQDSAGLAKFLVSHGADPTIKDDGGLTPLDNARKTGFAEMIDFLTHAVAEHEKAMAPPAPPPHAPMPGGMSH